MRFIFDNYSHENKLFCFVCRTSSHFLTLRIILTVDQCSSVSSSSEERWHLSKEELRGTSSERERRERAEYVLFILLDIVETVIVSSLWEVWVNYWNVYCSLPLVLFSSPSLCVKDHSCILFSEWLGLWMLWAIGAIYFWTCFSPVFGLVKEKGKYLYFLSFSFC